MAKKKVGRPKGSKNKINTIIKVKKVDDPNKTGYRGGQYNNQNAAKWIVEDALSLGNDLIAWLTKQPTNMFYEEFLVIEKGLYPDLIAKLSKKFKSFSELIEKAKKIQEMKLLKYGVADKLNASMTKFVMINNHGYKSEKQDFDHTTKGDKISSVVFTVVDE